GKSHIKPETGCSLAHEHHVPRVLHHSFGHGRSVLDIVQRAHRSRAPRGTMHEAGIKLCHSVFIGQSAQAYAVIVRIVFRSGNHGKSSVKRVCSPTQLFVAGIKIVVTVGSANNDVSGIGRSWHYLVGRLHLSWVGVLSGSQRGGSDSQSGKEISSLHEDLTLR